MNKPRKYTLKRILNTFVALAVLFSVLSITVPPALGDNSEDNFLIPDYGYTVDYYRSFGEPMIQASIKGDPELKRGEIADLQVKIVNKGMVGELKRMNGKQGNLPPSKEELLALAEMEEELNCTTAKGIKATLVSNSDYIHVEPATSVQTLDELETGHTQTLRFTLRIDSNAPAGNYELKLPVNYQYQSNVRTATGKVAYLGVPDTEFTQEYSAKDIVLPVHISIKKEPRFEISTVSGSLKQGSSGVVNVTYTNHGDAVAEDAQVRVVVMKPLSISNSIVGLGTIAPGESRTASFKILAEPDSVVKKYGIDSEIKYIDNDGKTSFSDNMKVDVPMQQSKSRISTSTIVGIAIVLILIYQTVKVLRNRKKYSVNASGDEND